MNSVRIVLANSHIQILLEDDKRGTAVVSPHPHGQSGEHARLYRGEPPRCWHIRRHTSSVRRPRPCPRSVQSSPTHDTHRRVPSPHSFFDEGGGLAARLATLRSEGLPHGTYPAVARAHRPLNREVGRAESAASAAHQQRQHNAGGRGACGPLRHCMKDRTQENLVRRQWLARAYFMRLSAGAAASYWFERIQRSAAPTAAECAYHTAPPGA